MDDLQLYFSEPETECLKKRGKITKHVLFTSGEKMIIRIRRID